MKEDLKRIDELLNGFIDDELTAREHMEVQRLISHDQTIAERLRQLERCRLLVSSLPRADAPAGLAEDVKASLERKTLLGRHVSDFDERAGARGLLARRLTATAAMIGLVAVLGAVIFAILAPGPVSEEPVAVETLPPARLRSEKFTVSTGAAAILTQPMSLASRLEFRTNNPEAVSAIVNKALEAEALLKRVYGHAASSRSLSCSRESLGRLLASWEGVWARLDSATLFVQAGEDDEPVIIENVTFEQAVEVFERDLAGGLRIAKDFAVLNEIAGDVPGKELLVAADSGRVDFGIIPKPVLTSSERNLKGQTDQTTEEQQVKLIIEIIKTD